MMTRVDGRYRSALRFILSRELFGMKLGLENVAGFLDSLGNPQHNFRSIHIAGTNGKGSTAAYLDAVFRRAGYKTGLFTSPHLVDFRERIKIDGKKINEEYITAFVEKHRREISRRKITYFEVCTALAFSYFAERKVDMAIIEVGLGGRLDATNTILPELSIITDISYDHTHILGKTLRKIAFEKAGIIKKDIPVLMGLLPLSAEREILKVSRERSAPMVKLSKSNFSQIDKKFGFRYKHGGLILNNLHSSLPGEHQMGNAALSIRAIEMMRQRGFVISDRDIRESIEGTVWPGRFQIVKRPGYPTVILDVGHNPGGMKAMAKCFRALYPGRKAAVVVGMVQTKDLRKSLANLGPISSRLEITRLKTHRTVEPEAVAALFPKWRDKISVSQSLTRAARKLIAKGDSDDIVIVCGSHYGVGEFLENQDLIYAK
ncbi:conserved hypothetical protein [Candidatus Zixiibacteriota bacterium]|nr:conserved hypothetical protein [candidate division Zixibacteria bacterium]